MNKVTINQYAQKKGLSNGYIRTRIWRLNLHPVGNIYVPHVRSNHKYQFAYDEDLLDQYFSLKEIPTAQYMEDDNLVSRQDLVNIYKCSYMSVLLFIKHKSIEPVGLSKLSSTRRSCLYDLAEIKKHGFSTKKYNLKNNRGKNDRT